MEQVSKSLSSIAQTAQPSKEEPSEYCGSCFFGTIQREDGTVTAICECVKVKLRKRYLGDRFYNIDLADIEPRTDKQRKLKTLLIEGPSTNIFLSGEIRKGKTHFLAAAFIFWHKRSDLVKYFDDALLRDELRNAELKNDMSFARDIARDYRHIFLDDIGKAGMSESYRKGLYTFINEIYKNNKHIFITSNDPISVLGKEENWGPYVTRRIEDLCEIVEF